MNTLRLFWALRPPIPELSDATRVLRSIAEPCLRAGLKVAWADPSSLHVTLKYLGVTAVAQVGAIVETMKQALRGQDALSCPRLLLDGLGAFPSREEPKVLFIEVRDETAPALSALHAAAEQAMAACGFANEARPYHPHLTLGRVRDRGRPFDKAALAQIFAKSDDAPRGEAFLANELFLYESRPTAAGVQYVPLAGVSVENPSAPAQPLS